MSNTRFYTLHLEGCNFYGEVSASGPVIVDERASWVALGVCSIVRRVNPAWQRKMLDSGGHEDSLIDPTPRWWIVKYTDELRINIDSFSDASRQQISDQFGIPIRDTGIGAGDFGKRFIDSDAAEGLREWAKKHPRLLKRYGVHDDYIRRWPEILTSGV